MYTCFTEGFSDRPTSLQDILKMLNKSLSTMNFTISEHATKITDNHDSILTKADATVAVSVDALDRKVTVIEHHLKQASSYYSCC